MHSRTWVELSHQSSRIWKCVIPDLLPVCRALTFCRKVVNTCPKLLWMSRRTQACLSLWVSQACYGILKVPRGNWLCRTCALGVQPKCLLCPKRGGALKPTRSGTKWVHVSCALWIPEVRHRGRRVSAAAAHVGLASFARVSPGRCSGSHTPLSRGESQQHIPPRFVSSRGASGSSSLLLLIAILSPLIELIVFIALFVFGCHWRGKR